MVTGVSQLSSEAYAEYTQSLFPYRELNQGDLSDFLPDQGLGDGARPTYVAPRGVALVGADDSVDGFPATPRAGA